MKWKPLQHVIQILNPDTSKNAGLLVLDLKSEEEALKVARKLALATGRRVVLRDAALVEIETIPSASIH